MKLIDWKKKGNLVRLYFCNDEDYEHAWGDDWDDAPYEHNAGRVYDEYIAAYLDICFNYEVVVSEPADDWVYRGNSPFCKEDFKNRIVPCVVAVNLQDERYERWGAADYHVLASIPEDDSDVVKLYFGTDPINSVLKNDMIAWTNFIIID